jgi:hypothetical protein
MMILARVVAVAVVFLVFEPVQVALQVRLTIY